MHIIISMVKYTWYKHSYCKIIMPSIIYTPGHFSYSWCMSIMRFAIENSKAGREMHKLEELILTLIKARRESDNPEKVLCIIILCTILRQTA